MEIKVSIALETALEFIIDVATCKQEEYTEKCQLTLSFISSLEDKILDVDKERLFDAYTAISRVRRSIGRHKKVEG